MDLLFKVADLDFKAHFKFRVPFLELINLLLHPLSNGIILLFKFLILLHALLPDVVDTFLSVLLTNDGFSFPVLDISKHGVMGLPLIIILGSFFLELKFQELVLLFEDSLIFLPLLLSNFDALL